MAEKVAGNGWESRQKIRSNSGRAVQVDRGRDFGQVFEVVVGSTKTKHKLDFIVDIASIQLPQKSNNLVMIWLLKNTLKLD